MALVSTILTGVAVVSVGVGGVLLFTAKPPASDTAGLCSKPDTRLVVERSKLRGASNQALGHPSALGLRCSDVTGCLLILCRPPESS